MTWDPSKTAPVDVAVEPVQVGVLAGQDGRPGPARTGRWSSGTGRTACPRRRADPGWGSSPGGPRTRPRPGRPDRRTGRTGCSACERGRSKVPAGWPAARSRGAARGSPGSATPAWLVVCVSCGRRANATKGKDGEPQMGHRWSRIGGGKPFGSCAEMVTARTKPTALRWVPTAAPWASPTSLNGLGT